MILYEILNATGFEFNFVYFKIVLMAIRVVVIYFILKDSLSFVIKGVSLKVKSKEMSQIIWLILIYMLLINFKFTFIILVISSLVINYFMKLREMQISMLDNTLIKR